VRGGEFPAQSASLSVLLAQDAAQLAQVEVAARQDAHDRLARQPVAQPQGRRFILF
jgi:hypothetical protein